MIRALWTSPRLVALPVVVAVVTASCSFSFSVGGFDASEVEEIIEEEGAEGFEGFSVGDATCDAPDDIEDGTTFTCTLDVEGEAVPYEVDVRDADDGSFTWRRTSAVLDVDTLEGIVSDQYSEQAGGSVTIDCRADSAVVVAAVGEVLRCASTGDVAVSDGVDIEVTDLDGTINWEPAT